MALHFFYSIVVREGTGGPSLSEGKGVGCLLTKKNSIREKSQEGGLGLTGLNPIVKNHIIPDFDKTVNITGVHRR